MLQNLIALVRENASTLHSAAIPAERKEEAVQLAGNSIYDGLQSVLAGGGVSTVMSFLKGGATNLTSSPVFSSITDNFTNRFSSSFGMDTQQASGLASSFLPGVLSQFITKTNDPSNTSFNVQSMFDEMSGGKTSKFDIGSMFNKAKAGLDKDGDGDVDFQDLKTIFTGPGGFVDKIKDAFK